MQQLIKHLKQDSFPYSVESGEILHALGDGLIGTDVENIIDEIVSPAGNPSIRITIGWPNGSHPSSHVYIYAAQEDRLNVSSFNRLKAT